MAREYGGKMAALNDNRPYLFHASRYLSTRVSRFGVAFCVASCHERDEVLLLNEHIRLFIVTGHRSYLHSRVPHR